MELPHGLGAMGRSFLGAALAGSGALQLVIADYVRLVPKADASTPVSPAGPYLVGVVLLAAGVAVLAGRRISLAGTVVAALILFSFVFRSLPQAIGNPWAGFMWTNPLKALALAGGALLAGALPRGEHPGGAQKPGARIGLLAAVLLAAFLVVCGVQHFVYREFVAGMVPSWIPPGQRFWTYLTGVALISGGVGILVPATGRLAAALSGLMVVLWVFLLHIPRAVAGPAHSNETAGVFEALAISGIALMVSETRPRRRARPRVQAGSD